MNNEIGIMLISFGYQYEKITPNLVDNIRKFSDIPILIHTNIQKDVSSVNYEKINNIKVIYHNLNDDDNRIIKTQLSKFTEFEKTLYVDVDSEIISDKFLIPFNDLESYDICLPINYDNLNINNIDEKLKHNSGLYIFKKKLIQHKETIPNDFFIPGGGVCYFKKSKIVDDFFYDFYIDWLIDKGRDMPSLFFTTFKYLNILNIKKLSIKEYNGGKSTIIKSLHSADIESKQLGNDFIRRRFNPNTNKWEFYRQGDKDFINLPKIAFIYDVVGWAFYIISHNLKKQLNQYFDIDVISYDKINKNYDAIISFSPNLLPKEKKYNNVLCGLSSHKNLTNMSGYDFVFTNDIGLFHKLKNKIKYYIPNGVDCDFFKNDNKKINKGEINLGLVSSLTRKNHKGSERLDLICTELKNKGYNVRNKKIIIDTNDINNIMSQFDMKKYYANIDIFVISSISETGPNPLLETMAMGIPNVVNKVGLVNEIIKDKSNGLIVENFDDILGYVNNISQLIDNDFLYEEISKNSIKSIQKYDWGVIALKYKKMIDEFLSYKNTKISIIIPTYKNPHMLVECLNSIKVGNECEILVGIDGCEETLNYVKNNKFNENITFFYFDKNVGPYVVRNSLAKISISDVLLFFDSDDIMKDNMIPTILDKMKSNDFVKPMYSDFNKTPNYNITRSNTYGEGVFAIKKDLFLSMNGFEPWPVAADSDFMGRLYKNNKKFSYTNEVVFYRRVHPNSLTQRKDTGLSSPLRGKYHTMSKAKKTFGPLSELTIAPFYEIYTNKIYNNDVTIQLPPKKDISDIVLVHQKTIDYNKINEIITKRPEQNKNLPNQKPEPQKPIVVQNKPISRNVINETKTSQRYSLAKLSIKKK